ncbi:hypothetical protein WJX74_001196 [Apatococcus lobatus]|uniref:Uncharacterized protein n=1 Tax=Apatococcus lobatus TaxID=904363 RepID=A0AAW1SDU4_9CHLO
MSSTLCLEEFFLGVEWPEAAHIEGFCENPPMTGASEALPAQPTSPKMFTGAGEQVPYHQPVPLDACVEDTGFLLTMPTTTLGAATRVPQQQACRVQGQQQSGTEADAQALNTRCAGPHKLSSALLTAKSWNPEKLAAQPAKSPQARATKRKAPGIRASKPKASRPTGPRSKQQQPKQRPVSVIQEGADLPPAYPHPKNYKRGQAPGYCQQQARQRQQTGFTAASYPSQATAPPNLSDTRSIQPCNGP